jgi:hypothetical protein
MDDLAAELREPRYRPQEGFRVWAGHVDGEVDVYADTGVTAEQLANALALYVHDDARLVGVEEPDCANGANLLRFRVAPESGKRAGDPGWWRIVTSPEIPADPAVPRRALLPWRGVGREPSAAGGPDVSDVPDRYPVLVGALVLDDDGEPVELVAPFAGPGAIAAWMELRGIANYRVLPAHLPGAVVRR